MGVKVWMLKGEMVGGMGGVEEGEKGGGEGKKEEGKGGK